MIPPFFDGSPRRAWLGGGLLGALALFALLCALNLQTAASDAADTAADLAACQATANHITALRERAAASSAAPQADATAIPDITARIQQAAQTSAFGSHSIRLISPQSPQRLGDSSYDEVRTEIDLADVTLHQVLNFIDGLCPQGGGLRLAAIRLAAPPPGNGPGGPDTMWSADLTVAYTTIHTAPAR